MSRLQNIAIAGASGNIGKVVVKELLASGFTVTALQRQSSTSTFPSDVHVKKISFESFDSWKTALEGQDAVISFLVPPATDYQSLAADAAVAAGVKRFIPSEWGMNTTILGDTIFAKLLSDKTTTQDHLKMLAKKHSFFSWTGISPGLWFDWGLENLSLGFDKNSKTAEIADSGNERFQTTNLSLIAKVVAGIFERPEQTTNRYITIASFNISQNEILSLIEQVTGEKWNVQSFSVDEAQEAAEKALAAGDFDKAFYPLLHGRLLKDGAGLALKPGENFAHDVLGFSKENPVDAIKGWLDI